MFIGYYTKDMIIGLGTDFWGNSLYVLPENMNRIDAEFIDHIFKILPVILSICGATLSFILYTFGVKLLFKFKISFIGKKIYNFLNKKWFFDKVYNEFIGQFFFKFGYSTSYKVVDRGIFEIFGPLGLSTAVSKKSKLISNLQTGSMYHYTFSILLMSTLLLGIRQFWILSNNSIDYRIIIIFLISSLFLTSNKTK